MTSASPEVAIPAEILRKWQRTVDLLAAIMHVPSAVVCKLEPPDYNFYTVLSSSHTEGNPFPAGEVFAMDIGTFCETVIKTGEPLLVADGSIDDAWKQAPELKVGMVSYLGFPVFWPDGRMFGTICVLDNKANRYSDHYQEFLLHCRDVLHADLEMVVRSARELEDQRAHVSELFTRIPDGVLLIDRAFRVLRVNPEFTRLFGYAPDEVISRDMRQLLVPDDLREEAQALHHRIFRAGETCAVETMRQRKDGSRVPVSLICVPVPSQGGVKAAYVIHRNLTDRKVLEEERQRYHDIQLALAHANRIATLGQLSASIAHEINQPLTGIMTNSATCLRMLDGDPDDPESLRDAVRRIIRDGERASNVIIRLRALFSNQAPTFEPVDLNDAAREIIALSRGELQREGVIVRTELAGLLPPIAADRIQLQQVVMNLLRNALEAMSSVEDRPRDLLITTEQLGRDSVRLSVRDAGVGFDPQNMGRLFEAFYSTKHAGMGVGLAVSRSIIENHKGRLWAELNDGPGATFSLALPAQAEPSAGALN